MPIPKILHFTWKTERLPRLFQRVVARWRETHPDWDIRVYTDADIRALVAERYPEQLAIFDSYPAGIFRADAFRFFVLDAFGGVYSDLDVWPYGRIDRLLDLDCFVGAEPEEHVRENDAKYRGMPVLICNAFMGSVSGHPFVRRCIEMLASCNCDDVIDATGPRFINGVALTMDPADRPAVLLPNLWSPLTNTGPKSHTSEDYADALARRFTVIGRGEPALVSHLWRNSWILPIGYKGVYFWRWPNRLHWAWRRLRNPELARVKMPAPARDYDEQRLVPRDDQPTVTVGIDSGGDGGHAAKAWLARQTYPLERLQVVTSAEMAGMQPAARANALLEAGQGSDYVLLIGPEFRDAPADALKRLLSARRPVVTAFAVGADGTERNARSFLYHADLFKYLYRNGGREGLVHDSGGRHRLPLRNQRHLNVTPLTCVGSDFLLVKRAVIKSGVRFAETPYLLHEGSEAFGIAARQQGFEVAGMPAVEVTVERR